MNFSLCSTSVENLGQQACDKAKGVLRKVMIWNGSLAPSEYVDEITFLNTLIAYAQLSKSASNKLFPLGEAQDLALTNEANKEGSLNLGFKATILEGKPAYKVKIFAGADLLKRLRKFNNQIVRILEYDANGVFWGTKVGTAFMGYQAKLFFDGGYIATGQNIEEGVVEFTLSIMSNSEYKDNSYWMETSGNVEDITPLLDMNLTYISKASNVYKIGLAIPGSNLIGTYNGYDEAAALIAALPFTAGSGLNYGTNLPVTTVALDPTLKALTVTFDPTAFAAVANASKFKLRGPSPAALSLGDVTNVELIDVILTK